tara:strand:+ start:398 stop:556 length:159 start_codon:yes stop_codon:yes gene_type:complete
MIYYNRKTWFGTAQYRNKVIHKIFVNVLGKNFLVWYNKELGKAMYTVPKKIE